MHNEKARSKRTLKMHAVLQAAQPLSSSVLHRKHILRQIENVCHCSRPFAVQPNCTPKTQVLPTPSGLFVESGVKSKQELNSSETSCNN
jgi:hypothetical protein